MKESTVKKNNDRHNRAQLVVDKFLASGGVITKYASNAISTTRHNITKPKRMVQAVNQPRDIL